MCSVCVLVPVGLGCNQKQNGETEINRAFTLFSIVLVAKLTGF